MAGYRETGRMEVRRGEDTSSLVDVATLKKGEKVQVGDRVVRRTGREGGETEQRSYVLLTAKGGVGTDVNALPGTNVYLNGGGKARPGPTARRRSRCAGRSYSLMLYRHGYQRTPASSASTRAARRASSCSRPTTRSSRSIPSPLRPRLHRRRAGRQDADRGPPVTLGFHSVRLSYGEDYRDFFEVMEFSKKEETARWSCCRRTTQDRRARAREGDVDGAIKAYGAAGREHPDYAEARRRLGNIYLDDKEDYDRAIAEFETVLSLPENEQLIYKQFAVLHSTSATPTPRRATAWRRATATARPRASPRRSRRCRPPGRTRFFPKDEYDEALHDTYYYMALAYHKLYLITRQPAVMNNASLAWREYFDFFPKKLEGDPNFAQARDAARRYRDQIQEQ